MDSTAKLLAVLQTIEAATRLAAAIPALVESLKDTLGSDDQANVQAALAAMQARDDVSVPAAIAPLRANGGGRAREGDGQSLSHTGKGVEPMDSTAKLLAVIERIEGATRRAAASPCLGESLKETLGSEEQAKFQAALAAMQARNDVSGPAAIAALRAKGG